MILPHNPYLHERLTVLIVFIRLIPMFILAILTSYLQWQVSLQEDTNTFFGVTVDPGFYTTPEGQRIYTRWNIAQWVNAFVCGGLYYLLFAMHPGRPFLPVAIIFLFLFARIFLYRAANRSVRAFAIPQALQRTAVLVEPKPLPTAWKAAYIGGHVVFAAIFVAAAVYLYLHRATLQDQLVYQAAGYVPPGADAAVHNLLRHARWQALSGLYRDLILDSETLVIMFWLGFGFLYRSRVLDWQAQPEGNDRYRRAVMVSVLWAEGFILLQRLSHTWQHFALQTHAGSILGRLVLLMGIGVLVSLGLLWRQYRERPYDLQDHIADDRWKWGQFYVDRNDPAWLVPSRMGLGRALNYGNPATWFLLVIVAATLAFNFAVPYRAVRYPLYTEDRIKGSDAEQALYQLALQNLSSGDRNDAADVLVHFADAHHEAMSAVAGALADQKLRLPDAQRLAAAGVARVEKRTAKIDVDNIQNEDLRRMQRLAQAWDAMGAVYAAQGNDAAAEPYLTAAWDLNKIPAAAIHLAAIDERRGDMNGAKHRLTQSLGTPLSADQNMFVFDQLRIMGDDHLHDRFFPLDENKITVAVQFHRPMDGEAFLIQRNDVPLAITTLVTLPDKTMQADLAAFAKALQSAQLPPLPDNGPEIALHNVTVRCKPTKPCEVFLLRANSSGRATQGMAERYLGPLLPMTNARPRRSWIH